MSTPCPQCGKDDAVQKVAVLVDAGRSSGTFFGPSGVLPYFDGYTSLSGVPISDLARKLAPPPEPEHRFAYRWGKWAIVALFGPLAMCTFIVFCGAWNSLALSGLDIFFGLIFFGSAPAFFFAVGVVSFLLHNSRDKKDDAKFATDKLRWDKAIRRWKRSYFCHRDGIVFDPEANESCQLESVGTFFYSE
jgi:hypothetical protein